jgi:NAD(P)H-nitrite reductase large subunit
MKLAHKRSRAVVIGGGITALEILEGLVARGVRTHYFLRGERYWSNVLDDSESRIVESRLEEDGVQIHRNTELSEILGKRGWVIGVRTVKGEIIQCDMVAVAIGVRPRKELADTAGLQTDRGILVDDHLQASAHDVFAAGDVAQVHDPLSGKAVLDTLWGSARNQGHFAGLNMAGKSVLYHKPVPFNVTRLAGVTTTIIGVVGSGRDVDLVGIARGDSETWRQLGGSISAQDEDEVSRLRILVGQQTLLGAVVMGDQSPSRPLQQMITQGADITPIRDHLLQPGAPLGKLIADYWSKWRSEYATKTSES